MLRMEFRVKVEIMEAKNCGGREERRRAAVRPSGELGPWAQPPPLLGTYNPPGQELVPEGSAFFQAEEDPTCQGGEGAQVSRHPFPRAGPLWPSLCPALLFLGIPVFAKERLREGEGKCFTNRGPKGS